MARAVGFREPGNLATRTKAFAPLPVTRTARPGTSASQIKVLLPEGAGLRAAIPRSVSGRLASIGRLQLAVVPKPNRNNIALRGQRQGNKLAAHYCLKQRLAALRC